MLKIRAHSLRALISQRAMPACRQGRVRLPISQRAMVWPPLAKDIAAAISSRGFTLVEALISLVIIAIAAAGILGSFVAAKQFIEHSGRRQISANFVRQQVELIKASIRQDKWETIPPTPPNCDPDLNALALTATLTCAGSDLGWTGWKNVPGEFGNPATWNGQRRYRVTSGSGSVDYRVAETQIRWRAID